MTTASVKASVVIPTLNAGTAFAECLQMVSSQETEYPFEIIVIDSSSRDQTRDIARRFRVRLYTIEQKDFSHGGTRQFGIEQASGRYVVFLTQDAIPADRRWLAALVAALDSDDAVAGAYSRQLPRPGADPIVSMRLRNWLSSAPGRRIARIDSRAAYDALSPWQRRLFINFDDVSSCVRKEVMQVFPFHRVPFGEDLEWSRRVLEAGYKIIYEPASQVYHSHPTSILANYRRAYNDHKTMRELLSVEFCSQVSSSAARFVFEASRQQIRADWAAIGHSSLGRLDRAKWMLYAVPMEVLEKVACVRGARSAKLRRSDRSRKKIVLVTHDFPPDHCGGVAVYTYTLAKELSKRHEVHVFYRRWDGTRPNYSIDTEGYDGLPVTIINNNFAARADSLMEYKDTGVDEAFRRFLAEKRPDLIHFQFLGTGLSTDMVRMARKYGIPTVLTLHDYWFMCPRGQMVNYRWERCQEVVEEACARCIVSPHASLAALEEQGRRATIDLVSEAAIRQTAITVPDPNFVRGGHFTIGGVAKRVLMMHPPAEVRYRLPLPQQGTLRFSLALSEDTWMYADGEGVLFEIRALRSTGDEQKIFSRYIDPKHVIDDRVWHQCSVDLAAFGGETVTLILTTAPGPRGDISYCTAGWGHLRIDHAKEEKQELGKAGLGSPDHRMLDALRRGYRTLDRRASAAAAGRMARTVYERLAGRDPAQKEVKRRGKDMRDLLNQIDLLIAPSEFLRQMYIRFGVPPERIRYSDHGMNHPRPLPRRPPAGRLTFAFIGTLMATKGVHILLDAFLALPEGNAELKIYGPPPNKYHLDYVRLLESKVGRRTDIALIGEYKNEAIAEILAAVDAVVVPSIWHENSPLTIHEAFIAHVPVITSNIGGMAELVTDGINGLHFRVGDAEDLARKLLMLIETPGLLAKLRANVPAIKSIAEHAKGLEAIYKALIGTTRESE